MCYEHRGRPLYASSKIFEDRVGACRRTQQPAKWLVGCLQRSNNVRSNSWTFGRGSGRLATSTAVDRNQQSDPPIWEVAMSNVLKGMTAGFVATLVLSGLMILN